MSFHVPEKFRLKTGDYKTRKNDGNNGAFFVYSLKNPKMVFKIIASDGMGWEHVSVSLPSRTPIWDEMCFIKNIFWDDEDAVIQFHPPKNDYINNHPFCLHLWRPTETKIKLPDSILVGVK